MPMGIRILMPMGIRIPMPIYLYIYGALWGPRVPIYGALWGPRVPGLMDPGLRVPGLRDPGPRVPGLRDPGPRVPGLRDPGPGGAWEPRGGPGPQGGPGNLRARWCETGALPLRLLQGAEELSLALGRDRAAHVAARHVDPLAPGSGEQPRLARRPEAVGEIT